MSLSEGARKGSSIQRWRAAALAVLLLPVVLLVPAALDGRLDARPWDTLTGESGTWALWFLLLSLAITPLRRIGQWPRLALVRRRIGVGAACYAAFHLGVYVADQGFALGHVASEIWLRLYLTIGFVAVVILLALAATSTDGMLRWLGGRKWRNLHRLVYLAAPLAVLHFFLQAKVDLSEPALRGGLLLWLLAYRVVYWLAPRSGQSRDLGAWGLTALAVGCALATALLEAGSIAWSAGAPFDRILESNFSLGRGLRPVWIVLIFGLAMAGLSLWRSRARESLRARRQAAAAT